MVNNPSRGRTARGRSGVGWGGVGSGILEKDAEEGRRGQLRGEWGMSKMCGLLKMQHGSLRT